MAPQVYQWGMEQYTNNQGNIDALMRNALSYASPQRIATDVGQAEAGVQQGAEAGRQSAIQDLQSYGIDPSAGRYAALDQASRVTSGAAAAGAGNQQRMADIAQGNAMQNQAISSSLQNAHWRRPRRRQCRQSILPLPGVAAIRAARHCLVRLGRNRPVSSAGSTSSTSISKALAAGSPIRSTAARSFSAASARWRPAAPVGYQPGGDVPPGVSPLARRKDR